MGREMTIGAGRSRLAALTFLLLLASVPEFGSGQDGTSGLDIPVAEVCPLCADVLDVPVVPLDPADIEALTRGSAVANEQRIAAIDSMYRTGTFGPADDDEARREAHLLARLATINNYRLLAHFADDSTRVYEADEAVLADVCKRYSDPSLVAIARLTRLRLGRGRVCARYDVTPGIAGETILGGRPLPYKTREAKLSGKKRRVLALDLPTGTDDVVEVLLAEHYSCALEHSHGEASAGPFELFLVHDIQGGWLRKWGTHRPTAFMFWTTPGEPGRLDLPPEPVVGVRIYIPNLRLRLPSILPDINFDDLREIELPQPILPLDYFTERRFPRAWLETDSVFGFAAWTGHGGVPAPLRERFPDR
jgi:hypothetical protein